MRRRRKRKGPSFGRKDRKKINIRWEYFPVIGKWAFKIAIVCLFAFVGVWYFGQRVSTIGPSMNPVLNNGDVVLVNRIIYNASAPKRGDIIAFKPKGNENAHYYVKRIIGLPNDTIEIIESRIYINGKKMEEQYKTTDIDDVGIAKEKIKLGNDEYFVLGDNRENSEDSRNADVGNVKRDHIYGKVWFVISPKSDFGLIR